MVFTFLELVDAAVMSIMLGIIFQGFIPKRKTQGDPLLQIRKHLDWNHVWYTSALIAPAIILHELGHKFVALAFGAEATFFAAFSLNKLVSGMPFLDMPAILMIIAVIMALSGSSFIFFIPAYVAWIGNILPWQRSLIAVAGPVVNVVLWAFATYAVKKGLYKKYTRELIIIGKINGFLAIFNILPIPGFDGFHVVMGILASFGL